MHHVTLDRWSRIASPLHRVDPRVKIMCALALLVSLVLTHHAYAWLFASYFALITVLVVIARLPLAGLVMRAGLVLPIAGTVAALNFFGGNPARAAAVLGKSYLSACTVLLLLATTPLPALLRGLELLGVPRFLLMIAQFLYRYLFVLSEQAQHMMQARRCRASPGRREPLFDAAAGALGVLFARSYARAERIHQAMLARGFQGHFVLLEPPALRAVDLLLVASLAIVLSGIQMALWNL